MSLNGIHSPSIRTNTLPSLVEPSVLYVISNILYCDSIALVLLNVVLPSIIDDECFSVSTIHLIMTFPIIWIYKLNIVANANKLVIIY